MFLSHVYVSLPLVLPPFPLSKNKFKQSFKKFYEGHLDYFFTVAAYTMHGSTNFLLFSFKISFSL